MQILRCRNVIKIIFSVFLEAGILVFWCDGVLENPDNLDSCAIPERRGNGK